MNSRNLNLQGTPMTERVAKETTSQASLLTNAGDTKTERVQFLQLPVAGQQKDGRPVQMIKVNLPSTSGLSSNQIIRMALGVQPSAGIMEQIRAQIPAGINVGQGGTQLVQVGNQKLQVVRLNAVSPSPPVKVTEKVMEKVTDGTPPPLVTSATTAARSHETKILCSKCHTHFAPEKEMQKSFRFFVSKNKDKSLKKDLCERCRAAESIRAKSRRNYQAFPLEDDPVYCTVCGKGFDKPAQLKDHVAKTHEEFTASHKSDSKLKSRAFTAAGIAIGKPKMLYDCDECGKSFASQHGLVLHKKVHSAAERTFKCDQCDLETTDAYKLETHKKTHENPLICTVCNKKFGCKNYLERHMWVHTGEKPYKCEECPKTFRSTGCLERHKRVHTGEKPYACNVCFKRFAYAASFKNHKKTHTEQCDFKCNECGASFQRKVYLKSHLVKVHNFDE